MPNNPRAWLEATRIIQDFDWTADRIRLVTNKWWVEHLLSRVEQENARDLQTLRLESIRVMKVAIDEKLKELDEPPLQLDEIRNFLPEDWPQLTPLFTSE